MLGAPVTLVAPAGEVITLAQAKTFLRMDGAEQDLEIGIMAAAAVEDVEEQTGLRLLNQTVKVGADRFEDLAHFRVGPIRSVTSIAYRDVAGADQVLAPNRYELFGAPFEQGIRSTGQAWPAAAAGDGMIQVTLEVGHGALAEDVPAKLRLAAFALLRGKFEDVEVNIEPLITNARFWL